MLCQLGDRVGRVVVLNEQYCGLESAVIDTEILRETGGDKIAKPNSVVLL